MRSKNRRAESGMAVVAVIVLIAVLFMSGTVMALAVSSSLHTVDVLSSQDAIHYAAESAVARGVGAIEQKQDCPTAGQINGQNLAIWCQNSNQGEQQGAKSKPRVVERWAIPAHSQCVSIDTKVQSDTAAWMVLAWRGTSDIQVWTNNVQSGCAASYKPCQQRAIFPGVFRHVKYVSCDLEIERPVIHIASAGSPVDLGNAIIRALPGSGNDFVRTVVGMAGTGNEIDEADIVPATGVTLWNTVLP
jgi:Tfp pilus assembly protein FimT